MLLNNRYNVIRELGRGSFGVTFLAEDTHLPSRRRCVVKQFKPTSTDPVVVKIAQERFQQEAIVLERVAELSRQIPDLFAYFMESDQFYLVQEYIEGQTLAQQVVQKGVLSESEVWLLLHELLPVLDQIHRQDIIHRDLSPNNIMLRPKGGPVLIDFGAVKEAVGTQLNSMGQPTSIVTGTPGFMAAEQAAGHPIYSSDLYSLGLSAIYALTGKAPQAFQTNFATGEIHWQQHAPQVSQGLAAVLNQAIRYHPRERYVTATEMLQALQLVQLSTLPPRIEQTGPTAFVTPPTQSLPRPSDPPPNNSTPIRSFPVPERPQEAIVGGTMLNLPQPTQPKKGGFKPGYLVAGISALVALITGSKLLLTPSISSRPDPQPTPIAQVQTDPPPKADLPQVPDPDPNSNAGVTEIKAGNSIKPPVTDPVADAGLDTDKGFKLCNKTNKTLRAAVSYKKSQSDTWSSQGWWTVKATDCVTAIPGALKNRYFYVYGEALDGSIVWDGDHNFFVAKKDFQIPDAEQDPGNATNKGFFEVDTGKHASFRQNLCPVGGCSS